MLCELKDVTHLVEKGNPKCKKLKNAIIINRSKNNEKKSLKEG